jgi:hypothetical protein
MRIAKGERFQVGKDVKRTALVYFDAPFTGGFKCTLAVGTILVVAQDSHADNNAVLLVPETKESFERLYLTEEERDDPKYLGFAFSFKKSEIGSTLVPR